MSAESASIFDPLEIINLDFSVTETITNMLIDPCFNIVFELIDNMYGYCGQLIMYATNEKEVETVSRFSVTNRRKIRHENIFASKRRNTPSSQYRRKISSVSNVTSAKNFRELTEQDGSKVYFCEFCPHSSNRPDNMRKHVDVKHKQYCAKYRCSMCSFSVYQKSHLKPHYTRKHQLPESVAMSATNDSQYY